MFDGTFRKPVDRAVKPIGALLRKTRLTPDTSPSLACWSASQRQLPLVSVVSGSDLPS